MIQFNSVQSLNRVRLFVSPWTAACQPTLSFNNSWSLLKLMSIESVMPSNHLILSHPLLFLLSIFPSIRVFSNESALCVRWPKYCSFSFGISPSNEYPWLVSFRIDWFDLLIKSHKCSLEYSLFMMHLMRKADFIGKDSDDGKDWGQEEKGTTEDEIVGWHHHLNGCESEQTPGDSEGQGSLECCSPWGRKESDAT